MAKGRDTAAANLGEVLAPLRFKQQSGLLSIERMQGDTLEEGEIYLQSGRPVYAYTGQLSGREALNELASWREIKYAFLLNAPYPVPGQSLDDTASAGVQQVFSGNPGFMQMNGEAAMAPDRVNDDANGYIGVSSQANAYRPGLEWLTPRRLNDNLDVLSLPLTRRQRSVYLLVDGKRTLSDLVRCTGKSIQEVERILIELQERGLLAI